MENVELGQEVNGLYYDQQENEFKTVAGKVAGLLVDPYGRQFVQIKPREGNAINVDRFTVNASSEQRQNYIDVINSVREIEKSGNEEIEALQKNIIEACNSQINDLYATLTPLIDLSFDDAIAEPTEAVESGLDELAGDTHPIDTNVPVEAYDEDVTTPQEVAHVALDLAQEGSEVTVKAPVGLNDETNAA